MSNEEAIKKIVKILYSESNALRALVKISRIVSEVPEEYSEETEMITRLIDANSLNFDDVDYNDPDCCYHVQSVIDSAETIKAVPVEVLEEIKNDMIMQVTKIIDKRIKMLEMEDVE